MLAYNSDVNDFIDETIDLYNVKVSNDESIYDIPSRSYHEVLRQFASINIKHSDIECLIESKKSDYVRDLLVACLQEDTLDNWEDFQDAVKLISAEYYREEFESLLKDRVYAKHSDEMFEHGLEPVYDKDNEVRWLRRA